HRRQLDEIHPHEPALASEALDQVDGLKIGDPAGLRRAHRRHDRRVEPIGIDAEIIASARRDALQDRLDPGAMQVTGADEMAAPPERRLDLLRPRAALAAQADLE